MHRSFVRRPIAAILVAVCLVSPVAGNPPVVRAAALPAGFQETTVISGLSAPTVVRFAADGRVFVAEKSGIIKVFDSLADTTPSVFADLRTNVHDFWDRGMLGMALAPGLSGRSLRLRPVQLRPRARRHGAGSQSGATRAPRRPARPATAASSAAGSRGCRPAATR